MYECLADEYNLEYKDVADLLAVLPDSVFGKAAVAIQEKCMDIENYQPDYHELREMAWDSLDDMEYDFNEIFASNTEDIQRKRDYLTGMADRIEDEEAREQISKIRELSDFDVMKLYLKWGYEDYMQQDEVSQDVAEESKKQKEPAPLLDKIPEGATQIAWFVTDHGKSGDECWTDHVKFYKTDDNRFYKEYYEGYMGDTTISEVTEEAVIERMKTARQDAAENEPHQAYQSYDDVKIYQDYGLNNIVECEER